MITYPHVHKHIKKVVGNNSIDSMDSLENRPSRFVPRSTMSRDIVERGTNRLGLYQEKNVVYQSLNAPPITKNPCYAKIL